MSNQLKYKGRFIKRSVLNQKLKIFAARNRVKKIENSNEQEPLGDPNLCAGRRIVELVELGKNLKCHKCNNTLSLQNVVKEVIEGLHSILTIVCEKCLIQSQVRTGKVHKTIDNKNHADVNTRAVLGVIHSGSGCTGLNKILACLNMPGMSKSLFARYEKEVGPAIEEAARDSCRRGAEEERRLVIEKIDELCKNLPADVAKEIYPHRDSISSSTAGTSGEHFVNNDNNNNRSDFDDTISEILNIIVSYDMGWSRRGNGRSYDSLNGYASIIGFLSGKILDYASRNRKCKLCDMGRSKDDHDCRLNFKGSAKAMEADAGVELINNSTILKAAKLNVRAVIGDEDSATIAAVRRSNPQKIFKFSDRNHFKKALGKELYKLQKNFKEMKHKKTISHLKKCVGYALAQNNGDSKSLSYILRNIPDHFFNRHENCGDWCQRKDEVRSKKQKVVLKDLALFDELYAIFSKYANNACKISINASSQSNESFHNVMAHKAPKNICYSRSPAADYRLASSVCTSNDGDSHLLIVERSLSLSPGKYTASYTSQLDKTRLTRAMKAQLPDTKARRCILKELRENLRSRVESSEGIQYQSNCGFTQDGGDINIPLEFEDHRSILLSPESCDIMFFDLESSGFYRTDQILQIAAKCNNRVFSVYINPIQTIHPDASRITGLRGIDGELFLNGNKLLSIPLEDALHAFYQFMSLCEKPCLLVAHNASFDTSLLLRAIIRYSLIDHFKKIAGFCDTLALFRNQYPERDGEGMFTLSQLAKDFLQIDSNTSFHEALYDVDVLERLTSLISNQKLFENFKSYKECVIRQKILRVKAITLPYLSPLKGVITNCMMEKIASRGIKYETLKEQFDKGGKLQLVKFLNEPMSDNKNKPRVTNRKRILDDII